MYKNLFKFVICLWEKSAEHKRLTFFERSFFLILCILELFYKVVFFVTQFIKKMYGNRIADNLKIISVGNLSVGGTGKSVFVGLLVRFLGSEKCVIISRGYGGKRNDGKSFLVSDGQNFFCKPRFCGDEPYMLAHSLHVPVVVGSNRFKSCLLANEVFSGTKESVILDDGYQNHQLKKDLEILLIDARSPFGNNHCLPAGPLREKNYLRADLIVLTHADEVSSEMIAQIKTGLLLDFDKSKILCGKHKPAGLFLFDKQEIDFFEYKSKKFLIVAAIGSFSGFVQSLNNFGINSSHLLQFPDHHNYSEFDIKQFVDVLKKYELDGIITTQKDWSKLSFLIKDSKCNFDIFIFRITFEFLTSNEDLFFKEYLKNKNNFKWKGLI